MGLSSVGSSFWCPVRLAPEVYANDSHHENNASESTRSTRYFMNTRPFFLRVQNTSKSPCPARRSLTFANISIPHRIAWHPKLFVDRSPPFTVPGAYRTFKMSDSKSAPLQNVEKAPNKLPKEPADSTSLGTNDKRSQGESSSVPIVSSHNANIKASFDSVNPVDVYREHIADALAPMVGLPAQEILPRLQWTLTQDKGDLMLPIPALRIKGKKPAELATEWVEKVRVRHVKLSTVTNLHLSSSFPPQHLSRSQLRWVHSFNSSSNPPR